MMEDFDMELHQSVPSGFIGGAKLNPADVDFDVIEEPNKKLCSAGAPIKWSEYIVPSDDQGNESSCVARSWCGWVEAMIRYTKGKEVFPKDKQLDASRVWKYARDKWWGGTYDDGLYVHQGLYAMIHMGLLPDDTKLLTFKSTWANLKNALTTSPVVLGHSITDGWFRTLPNGCINHSLQGKDSLGGHAILDIECTTNSGQEIVIFQNSWGYKGWGYHGLGIMNSEYWAKTVDGYFYTASFGPKWETWENWKSFLVDATRT